MELTKNYQKGKKILRERDIGFLLDGVETEFVMRNNRPRTLWKNNQGP